MPCSATQKVHKQEKFSAGKQTLTQLSHKNIFLFTLFCFLITTNAFSCCSSAVIDAAVVALLCWLKTKKREAKKHTTKCSSVAILLLWIRWSLPPRRIGRSAQCLIATLCDKLWTWRAKVQLPPSIKILSAHFPFSVYFLFSVLFLYFIYSLTSLPFSVIDNYDGWAPVT